MYKLNVAIMDYTTASIRIFERIFDVDVDVERALIESGDFKPDTMNILWTKDNIDVIDERG